MYKHKFKKNKKNFYSKEGSEDGKVLFMGLESQISEEKIEGVADLEAEHVSALEELGKYKRMYKKSKTHMAEFEEKNNDAKRIIVDLKNKFLEAKMVETI